MSIDWEWKESDGKLLPTHYGWNDRVILFYSNYYVRVVFKVVDDEVPPELSDLFIDDGTCLKGVYIRAYQRQSK